MVENPHEVFLARQLGYLAVIHTDSAGLLRGRDVLKNEARVVGLSVVIETAALKTFRF